VRKILSILLALGVVLGLTVMAAPAAAQVEGPLGAPGDPLPDVWFPAAPPPWNCAGQIGYYWVDFSITALVEEGVHEICVEFPADTDVPDTFKANDIWIWWGSWFGGWQPVIPNEITVTDTAYGTSVCMIWPGDPLTAGAGDLDPADNWITVEFTNAADIVNPTTPGQYELYVWTTRMADSTPVISDKYTIAPAVSTLDFHFDFSPTFTGIAEDYIPAFKVCGMPPYGSGYGFGQTYDFNVKLRDETLGCAPPCTTPSDFWFEVTKCPVGATIEFEFDSLGVPQTHTLTDTDIGTEFSLMPTFLPATMPPPPPDRVWFCYLHFDTPGDYELKFFLECPMSGCPSCAGPTVVATGVLGATAYQFLDATKIDIDEKWDLISLPLYPYDTSIANLLAAMDHKDQLVSVWYFDQCEDPAPDVGVWHSSAYDATADTFAGDLTDMRAGNAYWIRTLHSGETGYVLYGVPNNGLWVFGTHAIMPDPTGVDMGSFDVCEGWNMVGFKPPWQPIPGPALSPQPQVDGFAGVGYLWNFNFFGAVYYGLIYEWNSLPLPGDWTTSPPGALLMNPGEGYWIPFDGDSEIYPSS
jgi:hypothetical protein